MNPDEQPARRKKARWYWRVARTGGVLLILAATYGGYRWYWIAQVNARLDAIREAGYPVTLEELDAWYGYAAGPNAADMYEVAFSFYVPLDESKVHLVPIVSRAELPERGEPMSDEMKEAIKEHLGENKRALGLLHKGSSVAECRYDINFRRGLGTDLSALGKIRNGARLLALEAVLAAEQGRPDQAGKSIAAAIELARSARGCPVIIAYLVGIASDGVAINGLGRVLSRAPMDKPGLLRCREGFAKTEMGGDEALESMLAGERCMTSSLFTEWDHWGSKWEHVLRMYALVGVLDRDHVFALDATRGWFELMELPAAKREPAGRAAWNRIEKQLEAPSVLTDYKYPFSSLILIPYSRALGEAARHTVRLRVVRVALSVELFRLKTEGLPEELSALVPDYIDTLPEDPFDPAGFRYKKLDKGYMVYSVGPNGRDDGGEHDYLAENAPDDIAFTVER